MLRNMVIGKLKYLIGPASGLFPTLLNSFPGGCRSSHAPLRSMIRGPLVVEGGVPNPQPEKKGEMLSV